jgi:hypothetical protein
MYYVFMTYLLCMPIYDYPTIIYSCPFFERKTSAVQCSAVQCSAGYLFVALFRINKPFLIRISCFCSDNGRKVTAWDSL